MGHEGLIARAPSVGVSGCNSVKSGVPTYVLQRNPPTNSRLEMDRKFGVIKA